MTQPKSRSMVPRRQFLSACAAACAGLMTPRGGASAMSWKSLAAIRCHGGDSGPHPHPTPRDGITADKVLTHEQIGAFADAFAAFDEVRQIPEIVDGIRCHCGCADDPSFYSLLSCYEGEGMARICPICQGQGRLAFRLHNAGKTLDEVRAAIDARYG